MRIVISINDSCGRRGCDIDENRITLPHGGDVGGIFSVLHEAEHDTMEVLCLSKLAMDAEVESAQKQIIEKSSAATGIM